MRRRQPLPRLWMMSDERQGDRLLAAVRRLPRGAGIVFRHYATPIGARHALFAAVRAEARRRGVIVLLGGDPRLARRWQADGYHGRRRAPARLRTAPVHSLREILAARRAGVELLFLSPLFATRSHPNARTLGQVRALLLARHARLPVIALGGIDPARGRMLMRAGFHGWAAIDALTA